MNVAEFLPIIVSHQETIILSLFTMGVFAVIVWTLKWIYFTFKSRLSDWKHNREMDRYTDQLEDLEGPNGFL